MDPISKDRVKEIFSMVKFIIETKEEDFLCFALINLRDRGLITLYEESFLKRSIEKALYPYQYVGSWVFKNHPESHETYNETYRDIYHYYRLAWCDAIIERGYI